MHGMFEKTEAPCLASAGPCLKSPAMNIPHPSDVTTWVNIGDEELDKKCFFMNSLKVCFFSVGRFYVLEKEENLPSFFPPIYPGSIN